MSFQNKVVVVTGAASGMGAAISLRFAELDASLCIIDINKHDLHKISEQCHILSRINALEIVADLRKDEVLEKIVQNILKKFGKIDVLVNCAGIFKPTNLQDSDVIETFDEIIAINLRSVVALTKKALPALIESKGCIINISSVFSDKVVPNSMNYSLSKIGVTTFTKYAAFELGRLGVRVNCISPGAVRTNILKSSGYNEAEDQEFWDKTADITPIQKCVKAEEIAEMVVFLASDMAASITGSDFVVDAGMKLGSIGQGLSAPKKLN